VRRIWQALRALFCILFYGNLSESLAAELGLSKRAAPAVPVAPAATQPAAGALQMLAILQRDSRLIDFLMEDIAGYSDDQIGAAVRNLHDQCRDSLLRYIELAPVLDGIEGSFTTPPAGDPAAIKFVGNVPAGGTPPGGVLRHKGWRAAKAELPPLNPHQDASIIAPAEIEIE
jgi:hypothetical protein